MFENQESNFGTASGELRTRKRYSVDTMKRYFGKEPWTYIENSHGNYKNIISIESGGEEEVRFDSNSHVTPHCTPFVVVHPIDLLNSKSSNNQNHKNQSHFGVPPPPL